VKPAAARSFASMAIGLVEDFAIMGAVGFGGAVEVAGYED
jgi:hypothetical protein